MTKEQLQKAEEIGREIERMENLIKKYEGFEDYVRYWLELKFNSNVGGQRIEIPKSFLEKFNLMDLFCEHLANLKREFDDL